MKVEITCDQAINLLYDAGFTLMGARAIAWHLTEVEAASGESITLNIRRLKQSFTEYSSVEECVNAWGGGPDVSHCNTPQEKFTAQLDWLNRQGTVLRNMSLVVFRPNCIVK